MAGAAERLPDPPEDVRPSFAALDQETPITVRELYPASPRGTTGEHEPSRAYQLRVLFVLSTLALFALIYLGLLLAAAWATVSLLSAFLLEGRWLGLFGGGVTAMLTLFFVKSVLSKKRFDESRYIEITKQDQPRLHRFVELLCNELGCPLPRAIHLTHEVNAAVFYPRSLLALLLPARKNLLIGVGLLNVLNLTELKAVLGHEFGHFSQSSMKLGQYVYVANQVIYDMVVTRDRWDELLAKWRNVDLRVSWPAWLISGVVWLLRRVLGWLFKLVNVANLSLTRQMEFDADRRAVAVSGSDALVSGLWKAERAELAMQRALSTLHALAAHAKFTDDVFYHQKREYERLERVLSKLESPSPHLSSLIEPYEPGPNLHFALADDHAPTMWATHPSNREREEHAKRAYLAHPFDHRPAWMLVDRRAELARALTLIAYEHVLGVGVTAERTTSAREVESAARAEEAEQEQGDHYHGLYENRVLEPGNLDRLLAALEQEPPELGVLQRKLAAFTGEALSRFARRHREAQAAVSLLSAIVDGQHDPGQHFELAGKQHEKRDAEALLASWQARLTRQRKRLRKLDRSVFQYFYLASAHHLELRSELIERYRFLLSVQKQIVRLNALQERINVVMNVIASGRELDRADVESILDTFTRSHRALTKTLARSRKLRIPKLSHIDQTASVAGFTLGERLIEPPELPLTGEWIGSFLRQYAQTLERLRRLHFKNLGVLLRLQEAIDPKLYRSEMIDD